MSLSNPDQRRPVVDSATGCLTRYGLTLFAGVVTFLGGPAATTNGGNLSTLIGGIDERIDQVDQDIDGIELAPRPPDPLQIIDNIETLLYQLAAELSEVRKKMNSLEQGTVL